jgi:hypothetical protein
VRARVRRFTGREQKGVKYIVRGSGLNKFLFVFGELVQHFVDELGLPPGTFPPWGVGTFIFNYVRQKGLAQREEPSDFHYARSRRRARKVSHAFTRRPGPRVSRGPTTEASGPPRRRASTEARRGRGKRIAERRGNQSARALAREKSVRRVAFKIARAIFEHGITAGRPFGRTLDANRNKIVRDMTLAFSRAIGIINRGGSSGPSNQ